MKYALYFARRKKKNKVGLIQGTRSSLILFNLVNIRGVVQHKWRMILIHAMVRDFAFGERSKFYSTRLRLVIHLSPYAKSRTAARSTIRHHLYTILPHHVDLCMDTGIASSSVCVHTVPPQTAAGNPSVCLRKQFNTIFNSVYINVNPFSYDNAISHNNIGGKKLAM